MSFKITAVCVLMLSFVACGSNPNPSSLNSTPDPISNPNPTPTPGPAPSPTPTPGSPTLTPTTTLAAQTANNSSASNNFASQSNGNLGENNVSKMNIHSLLYSGNTTKILAHYLLWFGQGGHMDVGYNSNDALQVQRQIEDMISRGIDGVIVDWYGPNNAIDQATLLVMHEAEKHAGFSFAIMIDAGAVGANGCDNCSAQQVVINLMQYVEQNYFPSSAYLNDQRTAGRDKLQHRLRVQHRLGKRQQRTKDSSAIYFSRQRRIRPCHERWQLFVGNAGDERLRTGLSLEFLFHRSELRRQRDGGRDIQGIQRLAGALGFASRNESAMWPDMAENVLAAQFDVQSGNAAALPAIGHVERL